MCSPYGHCGWLANGRPLSTGKHPPVLWSLAHLSYLPGFWRRPSFNCILQKRMFWVNLGYLSSTSLKAQNFMTSAPHVSTAPSQNTSETGVLELGSTDPDRCDSVILGTSGRCETSRVPVTVEGWFVFSLAGFFILANISSCVSAHSFPMRGRGVPSTPHIHFSSTAFISL